MRRGPKENGLTRFAQELSRYGWSLSEFILCLFCLVFSNAWWYIPVSEALINKHKYLKLIYFCISLYMGGNREPIYWFTLQRPKQAKTVADSPCEKTNVTLVLVSHERIFIWTMSVSKTKSIKDIKDGTARIKEGLSGKRDPRKQCKSSL